MLKNLNAQNTWIVLVLLTYVLFVSNTANAQIRKDSLIVFVGEKLSVDYYPEEENGWVVDSVVVKGKDTVIARHIDVSMDRRFQAKYRILQLVHGSYAADTIEFLAYVHEGNRPEFAQFNHVLLFLTYSDGRLYHQKYQYFDVYKTKNDRWASPYPTADYIHPYRDSISVKPEKIRFSEDLQFSLKPSRNFYLQRNYPQPFFQIKEKYAIPIYGNYVEELFKLKMETTLKARGLQ